MEHKLPVLLFQTTFNLLESLVTKDSSTPFKSIRLPRTTLYYCIYFSDRVYLYYIYFHIRIFPRLFCPGLYNLKSLHLLLVTTESLSIRMLDELIPAFEGKDFCFEKSSTEASLQNIHFRRIASFLLWPIADANLNENQLAFFSFISFVFVFHIVEFVIISMRKSAYQREPFAILRANLALHDLSKISKHQHVYVVLFCFKLQGEFVKAWLKFTDCPMNGVCSNLSLATPQHSDIKTSLPFILKSIS